jgi:hypothetical protein
MDIGYGPEMPRPAGTTTRLSTRVLVAGALVAVLAAPLGWFGSDALEADNDFCNACHLEPGVPLHIDIRQDFDRQEPVNLAGLHATSDVAARATDPAFRCIDCHGGVGFAGKARTKWLAAKDAFWFVVGHFEEPSGMAHPLRDADCRQCHDAFEASPEGETMPPFHGLPVHNAALGVACVACHVVHGTDGSEDLYYLEPVRVRRECAGCHREFASE